ncbi:unnamed protein product [Parajaminaea phylloscopi]
MASFAGPPIPAAKKMPRSAARKDARKIDTQVPSVPGLGADGRSTSATLPAQIDIESTISARKFEIEALQDAIKTARASGSTRAWQLLPRHARRRAASHNVLRLPARLRAKGLAELRSSSTLAKTRSQVRKRLANHPLSKAKARKDELRTRATKPNRRWLETHLWFSKRFRMSRPEHDGDRWGFVLPEEPSMKGERTDWRAAHHKSAIFDASWNAWTRLSVKIPKIPVGNDSQSTAAETIAITLRQAAAHLEAIVRGAGITAAQSSQAVRFQTDNTSVHSMSAVLHGGNQGTSSDRALCPLQLFYCPTRLLQCNRSSRTLPSAMGTRPKPSQTTQRHLRRMSTLLPEYPPLSTMEPDAELLVRAHPSSIVSIERALARSIRGHAAAKTAFSGNATSDTRSMGRPHIVLQRLKLPDSEALVGDDKADRKSGPNSQVEGKPSLVSRSAPRATELGRVDVNLQTHFQRKLTRKLEGLRRVQKRNLAPNVFELYGPLSGTILGKTLRPVAQTTDFVSDAWQKLVAPPGTKAKTTVDAGEADQSSPWTPCLSIVVRDPRLHLPATPKRSHVRTQRHRGNISANAGRHTLKRQRDEHDAGLEHERNKLPRREADDTAHRSPDHALLTASKSKHPNLFADGYHAPTFSKGTLDARRSALVVPGSTLECTSQDDCVPIIVLPRLDSGLGAATANGKPRLLGVTLIVPQSWGRPFFQCLMASPAQLRPLSYSGLRNLYCETGEPWFPDEWPSTSVASRPGARSEGTAWEHHVDFSAAKSRCAWQKRPPAKRVNSDKVGSRWPFGGKEMWLSHATAASAELRAALGVPSNVQVQESPAPGAIAGLHGAGDAAFVRTASLWTAALLALSVQHPANPTPWTRLRARARELIVHDARSIETQPFVAVRLESVGKGSLEAGDELRLLDGDTLSSPIGSLTAARFGLSLGRSCGMALVASKAWSLAQGLAWKKAYTMHTSPGSSPVATSVHPAIAEALTLIVSACTAPATDAGKGTASTAQDTGADVHDRVADRVTNLAKLSLHLLGEERWRSLHELWNEETSDAAASTVTLAVRGVRSGQITPVKAVYIPY